MLLCKNLEIMNINYSLRIDIFSSKLSSLSVIDEELMNETYLKNGNFDLDYCKKDAEKASLSNSKRIVWVM